MYYIRKCSCCQEEKDISLFSFKNKSKGILQSKCKKCTSEYNKKHYKNSTCSYKKKSIINNKKYRKKNKNFIDQYKKEHGCKFCGENTPCCLDFHHVDQKQKASNVSRMKNNAQSIKAIEQEISKCIVVCANCHRKIHSGLISLTQIENLTHCIHKLILMHI